MVPSRRWLGLGPSLPDLERSSHLPSRKLEVTPRSLELPCGMPPTSASSENEPELLLFPEHEKMWSGTVEWILYDPGPNQFESTFRYHSKIRLAVVVTPEHR